MLVLQDRSKPILFTMARLDRVKNLTGLVEWYAGCPRLRSLVNLVVVGGIVDPTQTSDRLFFPAQRHWRKTPPSQTSYRSMTSAALQELLIVGGSRDGSQTLPCPVQVACEEAYISQVKSCR